MTGNPYRKVFAGHPMRFPAAAYNAMIDAARSNRESGFFDSSFLPGQPQRNIIRIENDTGETMLPGHVVGLAESRFDPDQPGFFEAMPQYFVARKPNIPEDQWSPAIVMRAAPPGKTTTAMIAGVVPIRLVGLPTAHRYARLRDDELVAEPSIRGPIRLLCSDPNATGDGWGVASVGGDARGELVAVTATVVGGSNGTATDPPTWLYDLHDLATGELIAEGVDPVVSPHLFQRPSAGYHIPATGGIVSFDEDGDLVVVQLNEVAEVAECPPEP